MKLLTEDDVLPPALPAVLSLVEVMDDRVPTDAEAQAALRSIGATTSVDAMKSMQLIGAWSAKQKIPQMVMTRTFTSLDEVDRIKKLAATLMRAAGGDTELGDIHDPDLAVAGMKSLTAALQIEERMCRLQLEAHARSQPENKPVIGKNKLRAVNHLHLHQTPAPA